MANILRKQNRMIGGFADANKIDTDAGTFEDAEHNTYTGITTDMISYDATNNQLLLKVGGADSVIPFRSTELEDINPEKSTDYYMTIGVGPSGKNQYIPVQGYSKIAVNPRYSNFDISFILKDGTETTAMHPTQSQHTWTSYMDIPRDATVAHIIVKYQNESTDFLYYSLLA